MRSKFARLATLCALLAALTSPLLAEDSGYRALRAAFVYNFILFAEGPAQPGATQVCLMGREPADTSFDVLRGKEVRGHRIEVRDLAAAEPSAECNVLYVGASAAAAAPRLIGAVGNAPVLTVIEATGNAPAAGPQREGLIILFREGDRLVFDVNLTKARANGLGFSVKMLKLARNTY